MIKGGRHDISNDCIVSPGNIYGYYFVKMISQRKQGIQTEQIGKGKTEHFGN